MMADDQIRLLGSVYMRVLRGAVGVDANRDASSRKSFFPKATVKCEGAAVFRSQAARDVACLLDIDSSVRSWMCMPPALYFPGGQHVCDFIATDLRGMETLIDAYDRFEAPAVEVLATAASQAGFQYSRHDQIAVTSAIRLRNAKDLLKYGNYEMPLGDRVRLLSALDEHGTLTVAECLSAFSETKPIAGLAAMILHGFIEVDLDEALIGPRTVVRPIRS